jgi:GTP-binding protein
MPMPVVAIVGRPNVGKSTLFNRLVGSHRATVDDRPGVTRDRLYEEAEFDGRTYLLIDTGGIEPAPDTPLAEAMNHQVRVAIEEADVVIHLVDGRAGVTAADIEVADLLRRTRKRVVLAVNKIDGHKHDALEADFWTLGPEQILGVSAAHGRGVYELLAEVARFLPELAEDEIAASGELVDDGAIEEPTGSPRPLRIAVIGRPNVGKSTLVNRLCGSERQVVSALAGTTMDPIDTAVTINGLEYVLVDTAGVRRRARIDDQLERYVSLRAIRSIERCHVCILMIDGTEGPSSQDAALAALVADRGRALVILINKWDAVRELEDVDADVIEDALEQRLGHVKWAPHLFVAAKTGKGLHHVMPAVEKVYEEFNRRVSTPSFNRLLEEVVHTHTPPQRHHHPVRIYYGHQTRVRPPTFALFANTPEGVTVAYQRYLENRIRGEWGFAGSPVRIHLKKRRKSGESSDDS